MTFFPCLLCAVWPAYGQQKQTQLRLIVDSAKTFTTPTLDCFSLQNLKKTFLCCPYLFQFLKVEALYALALWIRLTIPFFTLAPWF